MCSCIHYFKIKSSLLPLYTLTFKHLVTPKSKEFLVNYFYLEMCWYSLRTDTRLMKDKWFDFLCDLTGSLLHLLLPYHPTLHSTYFITLLFLYVLSIFLSIMSGWKWILLVSGMNIISYKKYIKSFSSRYEISK